MLLRFLIEAGAAVAPSRLSIADLSSPLAVERIYSSAGRRARRILRRHASVRYACMSGHHVRRRARGEVRYAFVPSWGRGMPNVWSWGH